MAKYYVIVINPVSELEYTDYTKRIAKTFTSWFDADRWGLQMIGVNRYEVAKVIDAIAGHREPKD